MADERPTVDVRARPVWDQRHWRDLARCRDADCELFFPHGSTGLAYDLAVEAKQICASCPVAEECLAFAVVTNQEYGIWGGFDEDERRKIRRRWRSAQRQAG